MTSWMKSKSVKDRQSHFLTHHDLLILELLLQLINNKIKIKKNELVDGMRLNVTAKEMRKLVSAEAREQTRGFKRTESREEKKMSFKEKSRWFHGLVKTSQTAA